VKTKEGISFSKQETLTLSEAEKKIDVIYQTPYQLIVEEP
jgi:hypothetical protein